MRRITLALIALVASPWILAEEGPFTASATARADTQAEACQEAFLEAELSALAEFEAAFLAEDRPPARRIELQSRTDERLPADADDQAGCRVEASWAAIALADDEQPDLSGRVEIIEGSYSAECGSADQGAACKRRIETQAAKDLRARLQEQDPELLNGYRLEYDGFEGEQTFTYENSRTALTMDGSFYFRIVASDVGPASPGGTRGDLRIERKREESPYDHLEFTLFYTWDGNNSAAPGDLALSTNRWGLGLWVDNRIGVSAFWGEERPGTANDNHYVRDDDGRYDVFGIGLGYRLFDSHDITLENTLYYVDAEPYQTTLDNGRVYEAEDYVQAGINLKTNSDGPNVGWMLTWKLREDLNNYDSLSGGWYVEWQF